MSNISLKIASRQSPLAVAQAEMIRDSLCDHLGLSAPESRDHLELKTFVTKGDIRLSGSLAEVGGKGLFTKEIEAALLTGEADIAVHSMKDMPAVSPEGLIIAAVPPREDCRDAFLAEGYHSPWDLPENAVFGTSSVRRAAQLLNRRPDLKMVQFRGNVGSRLQKLADGVATATMLAEAGLKRLQLSGVKRVILDPEEMLPAVSQGILCVQMRQDHPLLGVVSEALDCPDTRLVNEIERGFLETLDGSCQTPIAGLAEYKSGRLLFRAELLTLDGSQKTQITRESEIGDPRLASEFGKQVAAEIFAEASLAVKSAIRRQ